MAAPVPGMVLPPDQNLAPNLLASIWTPLPFTAFFMFARFYVRIRRQNVGADDWLMLVGWILYVIAVCLVTYSASLGAFRHIYYIPPQNLLQILKLETITQPFGVFSLAFAKSSVAILLPRLLNKTGSWQTKFLYANVAIYFCISVVNVGIIFGQCNPPEAAWNPALVATGQAKCLDPSINVALSGLHGAFGAYLDFLLALLPVLFVSGLNMPLQKKIAVCTLLGLGLFAGVCGIMKTVKLIEFTGATVDATWESYELNLWAGLECPIVVIAGSAGPSKPLLDNWFKGRPISTKGSKSGLSTTRRGFFSNMKSGFSTSGSRNDTKVSRHGFSEIQNSQIRGESHDGILMTKTFDVERHSVQSRENEMGGESYVVYGKP